VFGLGLPMTCPSRAWIGCSGPRAVPEAGRQHASRLRGPTDGLRPARQDLRSQDLVPACPPGHGLGPLARRQATRHRSAHSASRGKERPCGCSSCREWKRERT